MENKITQFKVLTLAEMSMIKGAGPNPDYIGPPIKQGEEDKVREQNFFSSLVAFFTFDISAFFGTKE